MLATDLGHRRPVAVRRFGGRERGAHDGLADEGGHGARPGQFEHLGQLSGRFVGGADRLCPGLAGAIWVRRADMPEAAQPGFVGATQRPSAGQVECTERVAVIAAPAGDDDPALRFAAGEVIGTSHLERGLDRLRAAADRIDGWLVERQVGPDLRRIRLDRLRGEGRAMRVRKSSGLLGHDLGDRRPAVPDVDDDGAAGRIEERPPVGRLDARAVRADGDGRIGHGAATEDASGHGRPSVRVAAGRGRFSLPG